LRSLDRHDDARTSIDLRLTDYNVRVDAPDRVLTVLEKTLSNVPRFRSIANPDVTIVARPHDDLWSIMSARGTRKVLARDSAFPQIAGAIFTSVMDHAARALDYRTMRATVVEKDGYAVAMIGDDWESAVTLAAHMHLRGWRYIGNDNALFDPQTQAVYPIEKSLYVNASSLSHMPLRYRRAVEASPWYVTPRGISFYAVDPSIGHGGDVWATSARLCAVVVVDGAVGDTPAVRPIAHHDVYTERMAALGVDLESTAFVDLRLGRRFVETCDALESWSAALAPSW
jgi:hypothetical protein